MCLQCEARSFVYDRDCAGCVSRDIERAPEKFRRDVFRALATDMQERVRAVRAAQAAALDAAAADVLTASQRAWLTSQRVGRGGDRWKRYARLRSDFFSRFPDASARQREIAGHRLAEMMGV